jgi:predicted ATPase/DNA-binding SARP family transcriptional activator
MNDKRIAGAGSTESPGLRLYLLGASRIEHHSLLIHLPTRKAQALLAYLVLHPKEHSREKLAALFWGDSTDQEARRSLRVALAMLRSQLGENLLLAGRETVQIDPDYLIWIDVLEFETQATQGLASYPPDPTTINLDLYQGDLLPDLYDDWVISERERYRQLYLDLLLHLAQHWRSQGEYRRVIDLASRVLAQDPANEAAHQYLMFAHFAIHDRNAALRQYEACVRSLRDELGVDPSPETQALYKRVKSAPPIGPSRADRTNNLPIPLTSFIGREQEIVELKRLFISAENGSQPPPTRLLTLTGPGGCGKTRLAIQVANELAESYRDGVWWVDLASLTEDQLVLESVAKTLGVTVVEEQELWERLAGYLRQQHVLLVLDNCEQVISACAHLAVTLLSGCPAVQILATSREALGVFGEIAWLLPSLSLPEPGMARDSHALRQFESIRLFVERATAVRSDFVLTEANAAAVAQVCEHLDGIPLAIELAAARTRAMSVAQIADRLGDRLELLSLGSRTAPMRQQTLRAAVEWSYDLLSIPEQALFHRLSVFANGWTLEAAEAICPGDGVERGQVLDLLARSVDKSLVTVSEQMGQARYRMLETIREYGREKLAEAGEEADIHRRHRLFFLELAEAAEPNLHRAGQVEWLRRLDADYDNLHAALGWALRQDAEPDRMAGMRLAVALTPYWNLRAAYLEGRGWLADFLARTDPAPTALRAKAFFGVGLLAWFQLEGQIAQSALEQSIAIWQALGDPTSTGYPRLYLGHLLFVQREFDLAYSFWNACTKYFRDVGDVWGLAWTLGFLGRAARDSGDLEAAHVYDQESASLFRSTGDRWALSIKLSHLGLIAYKQKDYQAARTWFEYRIAVGRELGFRNLAASGTSWLGFVALAENDLALAATLFREGVALSRSLGFHSMSFIEELEGLAALAQREGNLHQATHLWAARQAAIRAWTPTTTVLPESYIDDEAEIADLRARLGEVAFAAAWREGSMMTLDQAVEEALAT